MIEFTKDELKTIYMNMDINLESYLIVDKIARILKEVDILCDHEFVPIFKNPHMCISFYKCINCEYCYKPE